MPKTFSKNTLHLGLYLGHDSGVAVTDNNGKPVVIYEETKFTGFKYMWWHPIFSLRQLLKDGYSEFKSLNWAFAEHLKTNNNVFIKMLKQKESLLNFLHNNIKWEKTNYIPHHEAHAESTFYSSPFSKSLVLIIDGSGERESLTLFTADKNSKQQLQRVNELDSSQFSYGRLYRRATIFLGYNYGNANNHTGKIMGLSSYGLPKYKDLFSGYFNPQQDLFPSLNPKGYTTSYNDFLDSMSSPYSHPCKSFEKEQANIAASLQAYLEDEILKILKHFRTIYPEYDNLCIAGGVGMNSLLNGRILKSNIFKDIFVHPQSSDCGLPFGAAHYGSRQENPKQVSHWQTAYWGYEHSDINSELERIISFYSIDLQQFHLKKTAEHITNSIISGNIVGLFQGKQEVGARALGNRSILTLPSSLHRDKVNKKVKFREHWRPFAPITLEETMENYFCSPRPEPFMSIIYDVQQEKQKDLAGINHIDGTARVQSVNKNQNPLVYKILKKLPKHHHPPVLLNTSFNINGQPIIRTVYDAIITFLSSEIDELVIEDRLFKKKKGHKLLPRTSILPLDRTLEPIFSTESQIDIYFSSTNDATISQLEILLRLSCVTLRKPEKKIHFKNLYLEKANYAKYWKVKSTWEDHFDAIKNIDEASFNKFTVILTGNELVRQCCINDNPFLDPNPSFIKKIYDKIKYSRNPSKILLIDAHQKVVPGDYFLQVICSYLSTPNAISSNQLLSEKTKPQQILSHAERLVIFHKLTALNEQKLSYVLYGTGKIATEILNLVSEFDLLKPLSIIDHSQYSPKTFHSVPYKKLNDFIPKNISCIILATNTYQAEMKEKLSNEIFENIDFFDFSAVNNINQKIKTAPKPPSITGPTTHKPSRSLIFYHISKCGGSSISDIITSNFGKNNTYRLDFVDDWLSFQKWITNVNPETPIAIIGQNALGCHDLLKSKNYSYITMLRHPWNRYISSIKYLLAQGRCIDQNSPLPQNFIVKTLSRNESLEEAKQILTEIFDCVGIVEHFDESILLFSTLYNLKPFNIQANKSRTTEPKWMSGIKQNFFARNEKDIKLYQFALQQFKAQTKRLNLCNKTLDNALQTRLSPQIIDPHTSTTENTPELTLKILESSNNTNPPKLDSLYTLQYNLLKQEKYERSVFWQLKSGGGHTLPFSAECSTHVDRFKHAAILLYAELHKYKDISINSTQSSLQFFREKCIYKINTNLRKSFLLKKCISSIPLLQSKEYSHCTLLLTGMKKELGELEEVLPCAYCTNITEIILLNEKEKCNTTFFGKKPISLKMLSTHYKTEQSITLYYCLNNPKPPKELLSPNNKIINLLDGIEDYKLDCPNFTNIMNKEQNHASTK